MHTEKDSGSLIHIPSGRAPIQTGGVVPTGAIREGSFIYLVKGIQISSELLQ